MTEPNRTAADAVIVGAGHNGLIAAVRLAQAGWDVVVCDGSAAPGGSVWSAELTRPGFVHDGHAMNHNLFLASPFHRDHRDELARAGLDYLISSKPFANAFPGGRALRVHQDGERTVAGLDARDREGWCALDDLFERVAPLLLAVHASPVPPWASPRSALGLVRRLAADRRSIPAAARLMVSSVRELTDEHLSSPEAKALLASWALHLDCGPDVAGGAVFALLESFADQRRGMALPRGGGGRLPEALVAMLSARGGRLRLNAPVRSIALRDGRADAVILATGERIVARRAIVASTTPAALTAMLDPVPSRLAAQARRFRHGPGTVMLHVALDGPIPWAAGADLAEFAYVHVAPYTDDLARTYTAAMGGRLPAEPLLVVGQPTAVDRTRAPAGRHVAWIQVRAVPGEPQGDELGAIAAEAGGWESAARPFADRVLAKLERYAPGVRDRVLDCCTLTPLDLQARNPNLVGGDPGSMHLSQSLPFRPRARTGVPGLWLTGTATWPGGGITGLPGDHTASMVLAEQRRRWRRP